MGVSGEIKSVLRSTDSVPCCFFLYSTLDMEIVKAVGELLDTSCPQWDQRSGGRRRRETSSRLRPQTVLAVVSTKQSKSFGFKASPLAACLVSLYAQRWTEIMVCIGSTCPACSSSCLPVRIKAYNQILLIGPDCAKRVSLSLSLYFCSVYASLPHSPTQRTTAKDNEQTEHLSVNTQGSFLQRWLLSCPDPAIPSSSSSLLLPLVNYPE